MVRLFLALSSALSVVPNIFKPSIERYSMNKLYFNGEMEIWCFAKIICTGTGRRGVGEEKQSIVGTSQCYLGKGLDLKK